VAAFTIITALQFTPLKLMRGDSPEDPTALQRFQATSISEVNTGARLLFWGVGLEMFRAHPLIGVGANNYEVAFPSARAQFSEAHSDSPLLGINEQLLTQYAHNEYVQILAELGAVGILLFLGFCLALTLTFWRALRRTRCPLLALGSGAGLFAFAISSGASAFSFRWLGSGLIFFFAAALVSHFASTDEQQPAPAITCPQTFARLALAFELAFAIVMFLGAGAQATNSVMHARAESSRRSPARAEQFYRVALQFNPFDAASHYDYGSMLYQQKRMSEAVSHFSYAVAHGINSSTSYATLAAAEEEAGDLAAAEQTLASATRIYPRSVFLLVRHAAALSRMGRAEESAKEFAVAVSVDSRAARGWYQLINFDIDAAMAAAKQDASIATPGELLPQNGVYVVLKENERRLNISAASGWRARVHSIDN
jgi:tetratricopeptide (TPR) repeat protein